MSVLLTSATYINGVLTAAGTTVSLGYIPEYNLVYEGSATWVSIPNVVPNTVDNANLYNTGFKPQTRDYAGIMTAIKSAMGSSLSKAVVFEDCVYDLGAKYIPIVSGVEYIGAPLRFSFINGGWTDKGQQPIGGTIFTSTAAAVFWDGATDQALVTATIAAQSCTTTAGSSNIAVPNSSLFTVNQRVYVTTSVNGFYAGVAYFVLSASANVITLGLADFVAIPANGSGALSVSAGYPNDISAGVKMRNLCGSGVNTFIKAGAKNTFSFAFSELSGIYATGNSANVGTASAVPLINIKNPAQSTFSNIITNDGSGQYYGADYPSGTFQPGNCIFDHIFNANNGVGSKSNYQRGLIFQAENGSLFNEVHVRYAQNNNDYHATITQTTSGMTNGSPNITVTDSTAFPVDMPVWIPTTSNPNGYTTSSIYFVLSSSSNVITLSKQKGGTVVNSTGSTAMSISVSGFPGFEIIGVGTGQLLNSDAGPLDIEGNSSTLLTLQNCTVKVVIGQSNPSDAHASVTGRSMTGFMRTVSQAITDFDSASASTVFDGFRQASFGSASGAGIWYDNATSSWAFSINPGVGSQYPTLQNITNSAGNWIKAFQPITLQQKTSDVSKTFGSFDANQWVFNGATGQTFTLPTLTDTSNNNTLVGCSWEFVNASVNILTLATNGTQTFNNQTGKISVSIPASSKIVVTGGKTAGGTLFWIAQLSSVV